MDLTTATKYATQIVAWLAPFCDRIQIAGSVRRQRPVCNDIDLVVIPKFGPAPTDLFGNMNGLPPNTLHNALVNYVKDYNSALRPLRPSVESAPRWQAGEHNPDGTNFILQLPKCQLDIYIATHENWGSKLLQRTGSKEHNVWLATRARDLGLRWELDAGLTGPTCPTIGDTEENIYAALGVTFIPPADREPGRLDRFVQPPVQHTRSEPL